MNCKNCVIDDLVKVCNYPLPSDSLLIEPEVIPYAIQRVKNLVADYFDLPIDLLAKKTRFRTVVFPRQVCMYLLSTGTSITLKEMGRHFGGKDHTTVIHSRDTVKDLMATDVNIREQVGILKGMV